jgi:hypothetical protein
VWTLAEDRSVYVIEHADGAGSSVVTIFLDDLDAHVAAIAARGLEPDERVTYSNGVRKVLYRDPDGNELGSAVRPSRRLHKADKWKPRGDRCGVAEAIVIGGWARCPDDDRRGVPTRWWRAPRVR